MNNTAADFGWHYPPGVTDADIDRVFGNASEAEDEDEDDNECYPYDCRRGKHCYNHYDG